MHHDEPGHDTADKPAGPGESAPARGTATPDNWTSLDGFETMATVRPWVADVTWADAIPDVSPSTTTGPASSASPISLRSMSDLASLVKREGRAEEFPDPRPCPPT